MMEAYPGIEQTPMFAMLERCIHTHTPDHMINEFIYPDGSASSIGGEVLQSLSCQPHPSTISRYADGYIIDTNDAYLRGLGIYELAACGGSEP